ncbi:hypothetical protein GQ600_11398 [Phytophthora cactorum]|nr:hypothetical protein GQ600_11398 [Phytophthora cactorum]
MPRGLKTPFQDGHDIKYAVEISERHPETSAVLATACTFLHQRPFLAKFHPRANLPRSQKRTTDVMTSGPLYVPTTTDTTMKPATQNFGNNILQHQMKKNKTFFDRLDHANTIQAHLARPQ